MSEQSPLELILDRWMPTAAAEERDAAHEALKRLVALILRVRRRLAAEVDSGARALSSLTVDSNSARHMAKSKRYFAYIRVSTVKQGEKGSSLIEQRSAIEAYAQRHDLQITAWFEEMTTAAKLGRTQFTRMLAGLAAGQADGLIIHKIDRSARNLRDWATLGDLIDRGLDVRFVTDNFDLLSRGGRLSADIQAVVAADYVRNLRDEVKKGMYGRLKQGYYPWHAPVGYLNNGKAQPKTIDPVKGPLVRELFERYATNTVSFETVAREMAGRGLRTAYGGPLPPSVITKILNNPFYAGLIRLTTTSEMYQGLHDPLISMNLFQTVQAILRGRTAPRTKMHAHLFRQMIRCTTCRRRTLTGELHKGFVYYRCHTIECRGVSVREDVVEQAVVSEVERLRVDPFTVDALSVEVRKQARRQEGDQGRLRAALRERIEKLDGRIARLTDLLVEGVVDRQTYADRKEPLLIQRQVLLEDLRVAQKGTPLVETFEKFERQNALLLRYKLLIPYEKREMLQSVGSNFSISGKNLEFSMRSPFQEMLETPIFQECGHFTKDVRTRYPQLSFET